MEHSSALSLHSWLKTERVLCTCCEQDFTQKIDQTPWQVASDGSDLCAAANCLQLAIRRHLCFDHVLHHEMWEQQQPECDEEIFLLSDHIVEPLELKKCVNCNRNPLDIYKSGDRVVYLVISRGIQVPNLHCSQTSDDDAQTEKSISSITSPSVRSPHLKSKKRVRKSPFSHESKYRQQRRKLRTHTGVEEDLKSCMRNKKSHMYLWRGCDQHANSDDELETIPSRHATRTMAAQFQHTHTSIDTQVGCRIEPDKFEYLEPTSILCAAAGCDRFAKTGNRCRFHTKQPLETFLRYTTALSQISAQCWTSHSFFVAKLWVWIVNRFMHFFIIRCSRTMLLATRQSDIPVPEMPLSVFKNLSFQAIL